MIKHLIKIDGEIFEIPLKVYNHVEQQKLRADRAEKRLKETEKIALDRLIIINNFKEFICESIDNAKEDCKKDTHLSNHVWLKALQYVYAYGIKHCKEYGL